MEFLPGEAFCNGNARDTAVEHALQLGVYCDGFPLDVLFADLFMDCVGPHHESIFLNKFGINTGNAQNDRYTCLKSATFPAGSTTSQTMTIGNVSVGTDSGWNEFERGSCSLSVRNSFAVSPMLPPTVTLVAATQTPTRHPSSSSPNSGPPSTRAPISLAQPISAPVGTKVAMSAFPLSLAPSASAGRSRKSAKVRTVAGIAVVAIVLAAVVVIAALRRGASSDSGGPAKDNEVSHVPNRPDSTAAPSISASLPSSSPAATIPVSPPPKPTTSVAKGDMVSSSRQPPPPRQRYQMSPQDLDYKDQVRHVPLVDARVCTSTAKPAAIADHSVANAETRNFQGSKSTGKRQAIDP
jgi:hypothetical protein